MQLPSAPLQYIRDVWQGILNELRREDARNVKHDAFNRYSGVQDFTSAIRLTGVISPSQITADQNNYNPTGLSTANVVRLSTDADRNMTGLAAVTSGGLLLMFNIGSFPLVLVHDSGSSDPANRFSIGANARINAGHGTVLWYDGTSSRWRIVGRSNASYG